MVHGTLMMQIHTDVADYSNVKHTKIPCAGEAVHAACGLEISKGYQALNQKIAPIVIGSTLSYVGELI